MPENCGWGKGDDQKDSLLRSKYQSLAVLALLLSFLSEGKPVYADPGSYSLFLP